MNAMMHWTCHLHGGPNGGMLFVKHSEDGPSPVVSMPVFPKVPRYRIPTLDECVPIGHADYKLVDAFPQYATAHYNFVEQA